MRKNLFRLVVKLSLGWTFIHSPALLLGLQLHTVGKLVIKSAPSGGASIFIDQKPTNQQTDFTFAVSPGTYWVAVTGGPDHLNCGGDSGKVVVTSGSVVTLTCTKSGWK
jgi:hypothetical protein